MEPIRLTVIAGGNPDDQYADDADASHLKLVDASLPVIDKAEPIDGPMLLKFADALIGFVTSIWWSLESWRNRLEDRQSETKRDPQQTIVAGRLGW